MKRARGYTDQAKRGKLTRYARTKPFPAPRSSLAVPRNVGRTSVGFPKRISIKHRYVETFSLTSGAGTVATYLFSANGMFDPNNTGGGHQPQYFDTLVGVYNHYVVHKSKITVQAATASGSAASSSLFGVYIEDDTTVTGSKAQTFAEYNSASYRMLHNASNEPVTVSKSWDAKQAFGGNIQDNDDLQGSSAANPVEQQFFTLFVQDVDKTTTVSLNLTVTIEYEAIWDELKNLAEN